MLPAEKMLSDVYALASLDPSSGTPAPETRDRLRALIPTAHDAPMAIAPLSRALRDDPTAKFAGIAESVVADDRAHPVLPGAATAVLRHSERYDLARSGVVHAVIFDVRRVSGTADVEENAQVSAPSLVGRTSLRILRRRVLKHDGTVVEPDPNPNASQGHADLDLGQTLAILFQSPVVDDANGQGNLQDRLRQELAAFLSDPQVSQGLFDLAAILWNPVDASWEPWLRQRFAASVAAAALSAVLSLCPEIDGDGLVVDIDAGPREDDDVVADEPGRDIWISELAPGGNGHIEEALRQYAEDPRRFFTLMTAALRDNDLALSDYQLSRFLETVVEGSGDGDLVTAARGFRSAVGAEAAHQAFTTLRQSLAEDGFVTFHTFLVALGSRVLRPGSGPDSDAFLLGALRTWSSEEERLGVELDARVVAYRLARRSDIDVALALAGISAPSVNPDQWRFGVIYGLLWPRGPLIRQSGLGLYSPFVDLPPAEPLLVNRYLEVESAALALHDADWRDRCLQQLAERGAVTLTCPASDAGLLADCFSFLATNPVQTDYLSVFARVQAIRRVRGDLQVDVAVAEALQ